MNRRRVALVAIPAVPRRDSLVAAGLAFAVFPRFWSAAH